MDGRPIPDFDGMVYTDCANKFAGAGGYLDLPAGKCTLRPVRFDGALAVGGPAVEVEINAEEEHYQLLEVPAEPHGGVGITLTPGPDGFEVEGLIAMTAALDSGIEPGMVLSEIDGTRIDPELPVHEVIQMLVGPRGTEVELLLTDEHGESHTYQLDRREITGHQMPGLMGQPG